MTWYLWIITVLIGVAALITSIIAICWRRRGHRGHRGRRGERGRPGSSSSGTGAVGPTGATGTSGMLTNAGATGAYVAFSTNTTDNPALEQFVFADSLGNGTVLLMNANGSFNENGSPGLRENILDAMSIAASRAGLLKNLSVVLGSGSLLGAPNPPVFNGTGTGMAAIWLSQSSMDGNTGWAPTSLAVQFGFSPTGPVFFALTDNTDTVPVNQNDRFALVFTVAGPTGISPSTFYQFSACAAGLTYF